MLSFSQCQIEKDFQKTISDIEKQYVPDSRVGVYSIKAEKKSSKLYLTGETDNPGAHQKLIALLREDGYTIIDSIRILPENMQKPWALVSVSVANMRKFPSHDAEMATQAFMGTPLKILKEEDGWFFVQTPDEYLSWIEEDVVRECSVEDFSQWQKAPRVLVTEWLDFLRDSATNLVVCDLTAGCILEVTSETGDFVYLSTPDGRKGKISKKVVTGFDSWRVNAQLQSDKLIATARNFLGVPYLWGGASIKGADCSGFVRTVYFLNGCILARDASQQALYGSEVAITGEHKFQQGDLVFFGRTSKDDTPARVTHVGLFLGDTEFIHSSGLVKINSFDSTRANYSRYRTISLLKVRRIIDNIDSPGIIYVKDHPWY